MLFTRDEGGVICFGNRDALKESDVLKFLCGGVRRRMRKNGHVDSFMNRLETYGEAEITWNFVKRIRTRDDHWVSVKAWKADGEVHMYCVGPQADEAVDKANGFDRQSFWVKSGTVSKRRKTNAKKRRAKRRRTERRANVKVPPQAKGKQRRRKTFVPAPINTARNEKLSTQFKKSWSLWHEAVDAVVAIFDVKPRFEHSHSYSARELAARELWKSLEQNGFCFAQFKRRGFTLRFDLIDGRWRGYITPLQISCTKDTAHSTYRKMREHFRSVLMGQPKTAQITRLENFNRAFRLAA